MDPVNCYWRTVVQLGRISKTDLRLTNVCKTFIHRFDSGGRIGTQLPGERSEADTPNSLPLPDVLVTREPEPAYKTRHPGPGDIVLLDEVADATHAYDTQRKARLYARTGWGWKHGNCHFGLVRIDGQCSALCKCLAQAKSTQVDSTWVLAGSSEKPKG